MSYRDHLYNLPSHMHETVIDWFDHAEPNPSMMGSFFRALLCNDLRMAVLHADPQNLRALRAWVNFLCTFEPYCWGDWEAVTNWYLHKHPGAQV